MLTAVLLRSGHMGRQALRFRARRQSRPNIARKTVYTIARGDLQEGDLVFWSKAGCDCGRYDEIHHVGIYLGDGKVVEASSSKRASRGKRFVG